MSAQEAGPGQVVASLLLVRHRGARANVAYLRRATDLLRTAPGVRFGRALLTTGGPGAVAFPLVSPSRSALLAVWEDERALDEHLAGPVVGAWRDSARELLLIRLRPTRSKGSWDRRNPFVPGPSGNRGEGPVAVLTRVRVSYRMAPKFYGWALPPVAFQVGQADGMLLSVGMTERPVRSGATFSIWRSLRAMQAFGYHCPPHGAVQRRAREHRWFDEELFVRFRLVSADGSWRGRSFSGPVAASLPPAAGTG
jgi:hypothetical protein